jgi:hypothetical protein
MRTKEQIISDFFDEWKSDTKRNGGVLIGSSIKELLSDFYDILIKPEEPKEETKPPYSVYGFNSGNDKL